jgi:hypothetical protein
MLDLALVLLEQARMVAYQSQAMGENYLETIDNVSMLISFIHNDLYSNLDKLRFKHPTDKWNLLSKFVGFVVSALSDTTPFLALSSKNESIRSGPVASIANALSPLLDGLLLDTNIRRLGFLLDALPIRRLENKIQFQWVDRMLSLLQLLLVYRRDVIISESVALDYILLNSSGANTKVSLVDKLVGYLNIAAYPVSMLFFNFFIYL